MNANTLDRHALNIAKARELHERSGNLLAALTHSGGKYSTRAIWAEIALCEAACELWDDGDARAAAENLRHEVADDTPPEDFDPAMSHPDSGKGFWR